MKEVIDRYQEVTEYAAEAIKRLGIAPKMSYICGGTDGTRLSFMGAPCPNISDSAYNYHSPLEWIAIQDVELGVKTTVGIAQIREDKS